MDRGAWWATVHEVAKSRTQLKQLCMPAFMIFMGIPLVAQRAKNPPAMQETRVQSLAQEDPLEKRMATHSNILAWEISWTDEPGGLQSMRSQRVRHD